VKPAARRDSAGGLPAALSTSRRAVAFLTPRETLNGLFQLRNLVGDDVPENRVVDAEILVDDNVTKARDLPPVDRRSGLTRRGADTFRRLADDL